jgi:hypothetical protein
MVKRPERPRDLPGCIKYVILLFLLLLLLAELGAGEYTKIFAGDPFAWVVILFKLLLIALMLWLIRVQRNLRCELTGPTGCTEEEADLAAFRLFVRVTGTAAGVVFGSYTIEVRRVGYMNPIPNVVVYPGGGASGTAPVVGGELGQINTISLIDADYEITLRVQPAFAGTPTNCTITFTLLKAIVYMSRFAGVPAISAIPALGNKNPFDPAAELRLDAVPYPQRAVGGTIGIEGAAYVYECEDRKIRKYEIRYVRALAPGGEQPQPAPNAAIPAAFAGIAWQFEYTNPDQYQPWTRVGPAPINLLNSWTTFTAGATVYWKLAGGSWNSGAAGSGRFSMLLTAEDTIAHRYHDIQQVWFDNHKIVGQIVKFQRFDANMNAWVDIAPCEDFLVSMGNIRIAGLAWDPVIDEAWWPPTPPNDNFGYYNMEFKKQFGAYVPLIANIPTRVPALPLMPPVAVPGPGNAGELVQWDLSTLDAGPAMPGDPPYPQLWRGQACTYTVRLYVTDTTVVPGSGSHWKIDDVPIKIVNDL